jgi:hypothetical protein
MNWRILAKTPAISLAVSNYPFTKISQLPNVFTVSVLALKVPR